MSHYTEEKKVTAVMERPVASHIMKEVGTVARVRLESGNTRVFVLGRDFRWHCGGWSMDYETFVSRVIIEEIMA